MRLNNKTPLLLCRHCNGPIYSFQLKQSNAQMNIVTSCSCTQRDTVISLRQYLTTLRNTQTDEVSKCHEHNTMKADKYCYDCSKWLCQECIKTHLNINKEHILIDYAITCKCESHNMPYTAYCQNCTKNVCNNCTIRHNKHTLIPIILQDDYPNVFDTIMYNLEQNVLNLINRIDFQQNDKFLNIKNNIQNAYNMNKNINQDLILLYKSICRTQLTSNRYLILLQNISINTKEYVTNELSIEEECLRLLNYIKEYYVWEDTNRCTAILKGHSFWVSSLVILNDGTLASGSFDYTIRLWNGSNYQCITRFYGHYDFIFCLVVLKDGTLTSGSCDNTIKLWKKQTHQCITTLKGHSASVSCLVKLNDGTLASGSNDETIKLWNTSTHQCLTTLKGHSDFVTCLVILNDGTLASGSKDDTIKLWNTSNYQCITSLIGHSSSVWCLVVLNDGTLASGSNDKTIKLWNTSTHQCITTLIGHIYCVYCLVVLNDGTLASGSRDKTIRLWNSSTYQCISTLKRHNDCINCLVVLNNGILASGSYDYTIKLWNIKSKCF